ncbi:MAG: (2Fe-2S)-binding protein, partial [Planctomycetes bacterium]|nr:(2Fe-2S)-binding protein [Planctomycetota bacterium]
MGPDDELCLCFHVTRRKVEKFCARERPSRASQVSACLGAGTGCGWCVPFLVRLHRHIVGGGAPLGEISPQQYEALRAEYRKTKKRPEGCEARPEAGSGAPARPPTPDP